MQYLLVDAHRRFLGTFSSPKELVIGDTFQSDLATTYAVIGVDWGGQNQNRMHSLTVIQTSHSSKAAAAPTPA